MKKTAPVAAKINLALVVGEPQEDGRHEVVTVLQRIDICDRIELEPAATLEVEGFNEDTLVRSALTAVARTAGSSPAWRVRLRKRIPVAAGLGGGSADAAAALVLANETLPEPLGETALHELATTLGADVPFFLAPGPKLAQGGGERLSPLELPQDYWVLVALPRRARKEGTGVVYSRFDEIGGPRGSRSARPRSSTRWLRAGDRATSPPSLRTTSPPPRTGPHRSWRSCASAARFVPTCPVRGRPSTGSSIDANMQRRRAANAPPRASGSPHPSGRFAG